jgi:ATP-dependent Clp protease ATP-binding subunit ClpA
VKKPLADELLFGELTRGGVVYVDVAKEGDKLAFRFTEAKTPPLAPKKGRKGADGHKEPEFVE